jgi:acyl-CoA synthetase (AMP-forming)/AMP-acid ligase II
VAVWHHGSSRDTVNTTFDAAVAGHADETFSDFGGQSFTYGETACRAGQMANLFASHGIGRGDTVVTILDNKNPVGRVLKYALREEGATAGTWDREAAGIAIDKP